MIEKVRSLVMDISKGQEYILNNHIILVVKYSKELASRLGADEEVCEIAAWLHDIKKLQGDKEDHHIRGAEEAGRILNEFGYDSVKTEKVKECILTHSADGGYSPRSLEGKIVASADALSHFDNLLGLSHAAFGTKKLSFDDGKRWLAERYKKSWNKMMPEAQALAKPKYDMIKNILGV